MSVVIPAYNEEESLDTLHRELRAVAAANNYQMDIIFVDDGSTDRTWEVIYKLAAADTKVRGICFRRNFGKAAGLSAGFAVATGDIVMTLDADLQDDPAEIPRFLAALGPNDNKQSKDVISGWKQIRHDPWHKVWPSRVFNWMVSRLTGVNLHDHNCGMKCYRREVLQEVRLYGELHRFVPVLAAGRGFRVGEIRIEHRARRFGHSKYGFTRFMKGFLDLLTVRFITGYGQRPQHFLGTAGMISFALGGFAAAYLALEWVVSRLGLIPGYLPVELHTRPALLYAIAFLLMGGQFMSIGFVAELFVAYNEPNIPPYSISARTPVHEK
jgi:dolichol-phosphate mannosyltransferase